MRVEIYSCDRCNRETKYISPLVCKPVGLSRDLCGDCIDSLKAFLMGRPDPHREIVTEINQRELQEVYARGAEALEAWALGATADQMAEHVRDMLSRARRETNGSIDTSLNMLLGIRV